MPAVPAKLDPGDGRMQIRYTGIHLSAPERVQYFLQAAGPGSGLGAGRISAGDQLQQPAARKLPVYGEGRVGRSACWRGFLCFRASAAFLRNDVVPVSVCRTSDRGCVGSFTACDCIRCGAVLPSSWESGRDSPERFSDTLAQGFVGDFVSADAVAMCMLEDAEAAGRHLDLARKMARYSLTEARRSVMDLRASSLDGQDLAAALRSGTQLWTAGSGVEVQVDITGSRTACLGIWNRTCCESRRRPSPTC